MVMGLALLPSLWFRGLFPLEYCLIDPVVKAFASRVEHPRFESRLCQDFSGSSHTSDLKTGTQVATLPGTWCYRVSAGTGWPSVCILQLGEMERLICNFYLSVAAHMLGKQPTKKHFLGADIGSDSTSHNSFV